MTKEPVESINIDFLDSTGTWRTMNGGVYNNPQYIAIALRSAKQRYPNLRFRAVGATTSKIYDMLM